MFNKRRLRKAYVDLFASEDGQLVLHDLMRSSGVLKSVFVPGKPDVTIFKQGEQNIVLRILALANYKESDMNTLVEDSRSYIIKDEFNDD